jgi:hypothetical protein
MTTTVADNTALSNFTQIEKPELLREALDNLAA